MRALGAKRILIRAAEQGYITQLVCKMPECFCPEELGGACYFVPVTPGLSDCVPTHEHFPISKREGGKVAVDNAILAHRLCNRIDYSITVGRSYASDLNRIRKARENAIRRNHEDRTRDSKKVGHRRKPVVPGSKPPLAPSMPLSGNKHRCGVGRRPLDFAGRQ